MKYIIFFLLALTSLGCNLGYTQTTFYTHQGFISFYSKAPLEDIEGKNKNVSSVLNIETGEVKFKVPIRQFRFQNATMQEHFNENYMESEKFPYADFSGRIMDFSNVDLKNDGTFNVTITGTMTIHGTTRTVTHKATFTRTGEKISGVGQFKIRVADYNIKVPSLVVKNIAEEVDVSVQMEYQPTKK